MPSTSQKDVITSYSIHYTKLYEIGSCTNSSYEDMTRAVSIVEQAVEESFLARFAMIVLIKARKKA